MADETAATTRRLEKHRERWTKSSPSSLARHDRAQEFFLRRIRNGPVHGHPCPVATAEIHSRSPSPPGSTLVPASLLQGPSAPSSSKKPQRTLRNVGGVMLVVAERSDSDDDDEGENFGQASPGRSDSLGLEKQDVSDCANPGRAPSSIHVARQPLSSLSRGESQSSSVTTNHNKAANTRVARRWSATIFAPRSLDAAVAPAVVAHRHPQQQQQQHTQQLRSQEEEELQELRSEATAAAGRRESRKTTSTTATTTDADASVTIRRPSSAAAVPRATRRAAGSGTIGASSPPALSATAASSSSSCSAPQTPHVAVGPAGSLRSEWHRWRETGRSVQCETIATNERRTSCGQTHRPSLVSH